jgi:hypothetical protein
MNFLAVLSTIILPLENWAEQKLASIGSAFLGAMGVIFNEFENDQRAIATNVIAFWQAKHSAAKAAGASEIEALEQASTAALNEFFNEERVDLQKVVSMTVTALEVSVANGLKP